MQRVNRIERSSPSSRVQSEENTDHEAHTEGKDDRPGRNDSAEIGYNCDQL
jgi:anti-sigma28 factor (negative regulator of flagellin synthesis)